MISITEAVDLIYHGRSNLIVAAVSCGVEPEVLKQLLLERVQTKPQFEPLQLSFTFHEKNL
jgi:acyl-CoA hydrolase